MLKLLEGFPDDVLAVEGAGEVTAEDYRTVMVPQMLEKMSRHKSLKLFYHLGGGFAGMSPGALWQDAKLGLGHWSGWGRLAVVTDTGWIADAVRLFGPLFHHPVRAFPDAEFDAARRWLTSPED
jgi:hypothetical protein